MKRIFVTYCFIILYAISIKAQDQVEVGIDEQLGAIIPLDVEFVDSEGDTVTLGEVINKPVLLSLVYYECPGICSPLLSELSWTLDRIDLAPGEDFQVIALSFDHRETPAISSKWKKNYLKSFTKREFPSSAWTFLTGDSLSIKKVTDAVGFRFKKSDDDQYLHAGTLVSLSPEGKISRYIFGSDYNQFDLKMALIDAESGKTQPTVAKMLQFCFSYDPEGRTYTLNITRIVGTIMLLGIGAFALVLTVKKKKNRGA
ncbi:MAG: SCO family protein [Melioribacteraceae bacterium]|nr:SCO family protein [Melioribacteraceae bacterium]MCF8264014.1 SCO family protein [Melioribacteraceae bacterium]MCF8412698.1 SCO family protein [Melioribacteraceae bacterium]MCF8431783.1 SCO family protein [Melioribacteraceae bacterium]